MNRETIKFLIEANNLKKSDSFKTFKRLLEIRLAFEIYVSNYKQTFLTIESYYENYEDIIWDFYKRNKYQKTIIRDFHNTLTSARSFVERYDKLNLKDPEHCYFKELRNYIMHVSNLPLISHETYKDEKPIKYETFKQSEFQLYLENQTRKHPNRNGLKLAREFSKSVENISLNKMFKIYNTSIKKLYQRTLYNFLTENRSELLQLLTSVKEINSNLKSKGIGSNHTLNPTYIRYLEILLKKVV